MYRVATTANIRWWMHGVGIRWGIRDAVVVRWRSLVTRLILGCIRRVAWIRSCGFPIWGGLPLTVGPFVIILVAILVDKDRLHALPIVRRMHAWTHGWRSSIVWTMVWAVTRIAWRPITPHRLWIATVFGLQGNRYFGVRWLLPCVTHGVAFTHKPTPEAIVTCIIVRSHVMTASILGQRGVVLLDLHSGCSSSHFFFRRLQVMQPVLVLLLKTRFRRVRSRSLCAWVRGVPP